MIDLRHRFHRVGEHARLSWRRLDDAAELPDPALTLNIAGGGIAFPAWEPVDVGARLAVRLSVAEVPVPVIALACVVWCELAAEGERAWEVGAQLHWVGWECPDTNRRIADLVLEGLTA